jgi:salicylate hydroxylase
VLERREAFAEEGAGIQIGPNGTRILAELGVAGLLQPHAGEPEGLRVMDAVRGREITRLPLGRWLAARHGAPYWTAHRADLHAALVARVRNGPRIRLSMGFEAGVVDSGRESVVVDTGGAGRLKGAALIAADGIRSGIRTSLISAALPLPAGKSAARTVIPAESVPAGLSRNDTHIWLAPHAHVVHYPVRAGKEIAIVAVFDDGEASEDWNAPVLPGWVMHRVAQFQEPLHALLAAPKSWRKWSLYTAPRIPRWVAGRVALLGDAAHPVLPFLAQGAVLALEDAVVLARCLAAPGVSVEDGLAAYERLRRGRARQVALASARNGRRYHLEGITATLRNQVLSTIPAERLMASYDWLYGWRAE